jgi:hypothetical protein
VLRIKAGIFEERVSLQLKTVNSNIGEQMDVVVVQTNARISRMSKRRQKIALEKQPKNVFTNVYPIAPPQMVSDVNGVVTFDVSFSYKPQ